MDLDELVLSSILDVFYSLLTRDVGGMKGSDSSTGSTGLPKGDAEGEERCGSELKGKEGRGRRDARGIERKGRCVLDLLGFFLMLTLGEPEG